MSNRYPPTARSVVVINTTWRETKTFRSQRGFRWADIAINVDQLNRMHFIVSFDSWEAWAKFSDTPNEEFQQFMATQGQNPNGTLSKVYLAESL